jgi:response regulator NasT
LQSPVIFIFTNVIYCSIITVYNFAPNEGEVVGNLKRILVASGTESGGELFSGILREIEPESDIQVVQSSGDIRDCVKARPWDVIVINAPLSDEFGAGICKELVGLCNSGILFLVKKDYINTIWQELGEVGVFIHPKPIGRADFRDAVNFAYASGLRMKKLEKENEKLKTRLDEMKAVDRAKCMLIYHRGMTEAQAHRYIEKAAMDQRISRGEVAGNILREYEVD